MAAAICAALLAAFTVIILVDVVCRYWFQIPLTWAAELTVFLFQVMSFFGAGLALRRGMHFGLGVLIKQVWPAGARFLGALIVLIVAATSLFLLVLAIQMTIETRHSTYVTLPMSPALIYLTMAISALMMLVFSLEQAFTRRPPDEGVVA